MAIYVVQTDGVCLYCKRSFEQGRNHRSNWEIEVTHLCKDSQQAHQEMAVAAEQLGLVVILPKPHEQILPAKFIEWALFCASPIPFSL